MSVPVRGVTSPLSVLVVRLLQRLCIWRWWLHKTRPPPPVLGASDPWSEAMCQATLQCTAAKETRQDFHSAKHSRNVKCSSFSTSPVQEHWEFIQKRLKERLWKHKTLFHYVHCSSSFCTFCISAFFFLIKILLKNHILTNYIMQYCK